MFDAFTISYIKMYISQDVFLDLWLLTTNAKLRFTFPLQE